MTREHTVPQKRSNMRDLMINARRGAAMSDLLGRSPDLTTRFA
jgi:hypothetical protein